MTWSGYIALGTISGGAFTEMSRDGYSRRPFGFGAMVDGKISGIGSGFFYPTITDGSPWAWDGYALFDAETGGTPRLVYPLTTPGHAEGGRAAHVQPSRVSVDVLWCRTGEGLLMDVGDVRALANEPGLGATNP